MRRICAVSLLCVGLLAAAGCSDSTTTPTTPTTPAATSVTQVLSGILVPGGTPVHTFTLPGTAALHLLFGSLTNSSGVPLGSTVTLTYGIPTADGLGCNPLTRVSATAALKAQINVLASAGYYCVGLEDTSGVPGTANYAIRVIYGTPSGESPGTISYTSSVVPGGSTSRSFGASADGVATITMESFSPAGVAALGLAVGFQRNDGTGCEVSVAYVATRGAQYPVPVDAGQYCVKIFDPGTLTELATFTLKILHP